MKSKGAKERLWKRIEKAVAKCDSIIVDWNEPAKTGKAKMIASARVRLFKDKKTRPKNPFNG